MKQISSGAESIIFQDKDKIIKDRISKSYRIAQIDVPLRNFRTKREAKILERLNALGLAVPKIIKVTDNKIEMEMIKGDQLKKLLDARFELAKEIGKNITIMHDNGIIHGDLTTSNMILNKANKKETVYFIDFGLSFFSNKIEDKAVDLHLFKQALESKHYRVFDKAYKYFIEGYDAKDKKEILQRLLQVESRGRYKEKI